MNLSTARTLFAFVGLTLLVGGLQAQPGPPRDTPRTANPPQATPGTNLDGPAVPESWMQSFDWRCIGPANMGGRITAISVYEKDPTLWYVATASGGLLKTVNNGVTFEHLFDHESTVSIGDVAHAPSDPKIVWVGTGESNPRNSVSWGDGVYKSEDGGKTWKNKGLKNSFQIGRVVIHPKDPKTVYVGALGRLWGPNEERGLFKTTDGGETWEKVLYVDDKTGITDLQMKPGDPNTLLAATYERQRDGFDTNEPAKRNGPGSGLWRSTDAGKTWTRLTKGLPEGNLGRMGIEYYRKDPNVVYVVLESDRTGSEPTNAPYVGLRGTDADVGAKITDVTKDGPAEAAGIKTGDIVIAVNDVTVHSYASFLAEVRKRVAGDSVRVELSRERKSVSVELKLTERPKPATQQRARDGTGRRTDDQAGAGPFSSGLGGQRSNFTLQQGPEGHHYGGVYKSTDGGESWTRINSLNPRPMYFSQVRADPSDDKHLWVLGVSLARSKDGGESFTDDGGRGTHADGHALWIDPRDGRHMIYGNDGGIYVSHDRGENWDHLNHVAIGQFYHVAVDPRPNYMVYGGLQDNGSWGGPSRSRAGRGPINEDWVSIGGGDGFVCRVDPADPDQIFFESQGGAMGRYNLRTGERGSIRPRPERGLQYRWNWKTPFLLSAHNSRIHYAAGNYVFRSLDQGRTLKRISDEITRTRRGTGTALAESPLDSDVLYVGSDDGAVLVTRDSGKSWTKLADFPLTEAEKNAQAVAEESESGGGGGGSEAAPADRPVVPEGTPAESTAEAPAAGAATPGSGRQPAGGAGSMADRLKQLDANGDGKIAKDEVPEQMQRVFDRGDANKDGVLDEEEVKALSLPRRGPGGRGGETPRPLDTEQPAKPAEPVVEPPQTPVAEDNPVTGDWTAKAVGEDLPAQSRDFTLSLTLYSGGKVTGVYDTPRGGGRITDGKFDAEKGQLAAPIETERSSMELKARFVDGKMKGELDFGGRFQIEFEAERTSKVATRQAAEEAKEPPGKPLLELLPEARWVSSIEASRFKAGRVYATFDGHRSNDDELYVFVSEDFGKSWRSIRANLPATAGSVKVLREDIQKENLLFLGTEFGAYVSVDRGASWTRFNHNLPTVAVFEFALHPTSGEIIAATHGRSIWICDVTPLRQMSEKTAAEGFALFAPRSTIYWRPEPRRGGDNRRFVGENDESSASIVYSLGRRARSVRLQITDQAGEVLRELETKTEPGLHRVSWDLRRAPDDAPRAGAGPAGPGGPGGGAGSGRGGGFGGGRLVASGTYRVALRVDGETLSRSLVVQTDPQFPDYQPWERTGGFGGAEDEESDLEAADAEETDQPLDRDD